MLFLAAWVYCSAAWAEDAGHEAEIYAFATIMAVTRTAGERCPGVTINEATILAVKEKLHIVDADYFDFRRKAHARAETIEDGLLLPDAVAPWCDDAMARYGIRGTALPDALGR